MSNLSGEDQRDIEKNVRAALLGIDSNKVRAMINSLGRRGILEYEPGLKNSKLYYCVKK